MRLLVLTAITMTAFAANSVLNRMGVGSGHIGAVDFALVRLFSGAIMLAVLIGVRRAVGRGELWAGSSGRVLGVLSLILYLFGFSLAYDALDAGTGALILFGMVQLTMFSGALLQREHVPPRRWIGSAVAFLGLAYLLAPGSAASESFFHSLLMAAAGVGWGLYSLSARGASDPLGATAWNFILALPVAFAIGVALPSETAAVAVTSGGVALAVASGALTSALGYALWYQILPQLGAARGGVAQLTVPVIALAGGVAFLGETLSLRFAIAAALVLGGVAYAVRSSSRG